MRAGPPYRTDPIWSAAPPEPCTAGPLQSTFLERELFHNRGRVLGQTPATAIQLIHPRPRPQPEHCSGGASRVDDEVAGTPDRVERYFHRYSDSRENLGQLSSSSSSRSSPTSSPAPNCATRSSAATSNDRPTSRTATLSTPSWPTSRRTPCPAEARLRALLPTPAQKTAAKGLCKERERRDSNPPMTPRIEIRLWGDRPSGAGC
jgi:hypothetical protein